MDQDWISELRVTGTSFAVGQQLGEAWAKVLRAGAATRQDDRTPWWRHPPYLKLVG